MKKYLIILFAGTATLFYSCTNRSIESDAYGNFEANDVIIAAEVSGKIVDLKIEEGATIKSGEVLGYIDSTDLVLKKQQLIAQKKAVSAKIQSLLAQIEVQKQQLKNLIIEKERIEKLLKDGAATAKQYDDIKASISVIEKQISTIEVQNAPILSETESFEKQIEQLNVNIKRCSIVSPISGTILNKFVEIGEYITISKPICTVANLEQIYLKAYVSGTQLSSIKIGQKVQLLIDKTDGETQSFEGVITWISPKAEFTPKIIQTKEERVNFVYAIKILVNNTGEIKIGMPGEVVFIK